MFFSILKLKQGSGPERDKCPIEHREEFPSVCGGLGPNGGGAGELGARDLEKGRGELGAGALRVCMAGPRGD